jgi:hypothetical protein
MKTNKVLYDGTNARTTKEYFKTIPRDYKITTKGKEKMMILCPDTGATILVPVKFNPERKVQ